MNNIIIKATNISKKYRLFNSKKDRLKEAVSLFGKKYHDDYWALSDINFEIEKGDVIGLLGKNGSGKSTLLQIISSIKRPTLGNIEVNGSIASILELGIDFNPELSGRENIILKGIMNGLKEKEIRNNLQDMIEFASIGDYIDQSVGSYSSGMLVRVAFASCISLKPDILIIDEALSVGDLEFQIKCINWMKEYVENGGTLIFVSHDLQLINSLCEKVLLLENGKITCFDKAQITTEKYIKSINDRSSKEKIIDKTDQFSSMIAYGKSYINIRSIDIYDDEMSFTNQFNYNDNCYISITAEVDRNVCEEYFLILLRDSKGYNIYGKWVPIESLPFQESSEKSVVVNCILKLKLTLANGCYSVTISINKKELKVSTNISERHASVAYISVSNSPSFMHGIVNIEH